jgi:hypothetical protein
MGSSSYRLAFTRPESRLSRTATDPLLPLATADADTAAFGALSEAAFRRKPLARKAHFPGVYQIGDVQARSWMDTGKPFGMGTPSRAASRVLQRGVGISITLA